MGFKSLKPDCIEVGDVFFNGTGLLDYIGVGIVTNVDTEGIFYKTEMNDVNRQFFSDMDNGILIKQNGKVYLGKGLFDGYKTAYESLKKSL